VRYGMNDSAFLSVPVWLRKILADPFRRYLILGLVLIGVAVSFHEYQNRQQIALQEKQISFFFHPQCPHCRKQKVFNTYLQAKYPEIPWRTYDTSRPENSSLLASLVSKRDPSIKDISVPMTFIGPYVISGFDSPETTGARLEKALLAYINNDPTLFNKNESSGTIGDSLLLPLLGEIRLADYSLAALAVIIGLVDGFNPCAMWVLVYLMSLIMSLNDRRKIWLLVGTFVASSGILYFLFMTAWLNVFLFMGYLRPLTLLIGLIALGCGIQNIRDYLQTKGEVACQIGDATSKRKTMGRIDRIVKSPVTFMSVFSIIVLAFIVNSIEFACSAALPAIFTHTLTLRNLPVLEYYWYILIYDFFFMLDDMIIFSLAVLALDTSIGNRYAKHCHIVGGTVLVILGGLMVFRPELLR
jgi:hypothetical protein